MASGRRRGTGLLIFLFLPAFLYAQEPRFMIQTSPDIPVEGSVLTLTLLTDHDNPDEVNVLAPPFNDNILLDYMLKGPRAVNAGAERWTAIEFRFSLTGRGTVSFGAFTIITPAGRVRTEPFDIVVRGGLSAQGNDAGGETARFRTSWENVPSNLKIGENAVVLLRINGWKNEAVPDALLFVPPVPPGYIIEAVPLSENEKSSGIALKLRIIPLQTGVLTINNRRLTIDNSVYEIPVLRIPVNKAERTVAK